MANWRHFAFVTDLEDIAVDLDAFDRVHAVVELCIDDWKEGTAMAHCPSGDFSANAAWMCCPVLAHNLIRWSAKLGDLVEDDTLVVAQTLRTRYFSPSRRDWSIDRERRYCADPPTGRGPPRSPTPSGPTGRRVRAHLSEPRRTGVAADQHQRADNRKGQHEPLDQHAPGTELTALRRVRTMTPATALFKPVQPGRRGGSRLRPRPIIRITVGPGSGDEFRHGDRAEAARITALEPVDAMSRSLALALRATTSGQWVDRRPSESGSYCVPQGPPNR